MRENPFPQLLGSAVAAAFLLAASPHVLAQGATDPKTVLEEVYGIVGETCSEGSETGTYDPVAIAKIYFSTPLAEKLSHAIAKGSIDFDVFTDSQDCGLTDIDLKLTTGDRFDATGIAHFKNYGEERVVVFRMARSRDSWLINDVSYGHRTFSLDKEY